MLLMLIVCKTNKSLFLTFVKVKNTKLVKLVEILK